MRILVHDYSGHPFQVHLSRALAGRGHDVLHLHCSSYQTGKGAVARREGDPPSFDVDALGMATTFDRYSVARRLRQEVVYGGAFAERASAYRPDVVVSSNDPLFAKGRAARWCRRTDTPWVFWLQDLYSVAMTDYARTRFGRIGGGLGRAFEYVERRLLRQAAAVVAITDDFRPILSEWRVPEERCHVIENWAPLDELPVCSKDNPWARRHSLHDRPVLLYSGTLGLKHDPGLLVELAERLRHRDARVVVVSEGAGADWLAEERERRQLDALVLLPYQPFSSLPEVFATADVLLTLLDPNAGAFSVPSKVLSYLCAGRAILAAVPSANLAARTIERAGAGIVVSPSASNDFVAAAERLLADDQLRHAHGAAARTYAERAFDIDAIVSRFEPIIRDAARRQPTSGTLRGSVGTAESSHRAER